MVILKLIKALRAVKELMWWPLDLLEDAVNFPLHVMQGLYPFANFVMAKLPEVLEMIRREEEAGEAGIPEDGADSDVVDSAGRVQE